jgi:hypothetical protein
MHREANKPIPQNSATMLKGSTSACDSAAVFFRTVATIAFMAVPPTSMRWIRQRIRFSEISCRPRNDFFGTRSGNSVLNSPEDQEGEDGQAKNRPAERPLGLEREPLQFAITLYQ